MYPHFAILNSFILRVFIIGLQFSQHDTYFLHRSKWARTWNCNFDTFAMLLFSCLYTAIYEDSTDYNVVLNASINKQL